MDYSGVNSGDETGIPLVTQQYESQEQKILKDINNDSLSLGDAAAEKLFNNVIEILNQHVQDDIFYPQDISYIKHLSNYIELNNDVKYSKLHIIKKFFENWITSMARTTQNNIDKKTLEEIDTLNADVLKKPGYLYDTLITLCEYFPDTKNLLETYCQKVHVDGENNINTNNDMQEDIFVNNYSEDENNKIIDENDNNKIVNEEDSAESFKNTRDSLRKNVLEKCDTSVDTNHVLTFINNKALPILNLIVFDLQSLDAFKNLEDKNNNALFDFLNIPFKNLFMQDWFNSALSNSFNNEFLLKFFDQNQLSSTVANYFSDKKLDDGKNITKISMADLLQAILPPDKNVQDATLMDVIENNKEEVYLPIRALVSELKRVNIEDKTRTDYMNHLIQLTANVVDINGIINIIYANYLHGKNISSIGGIVANTCKVFEENENYNISKWRYYLYDNIWNSFWDDTKSNPKCHYNGAMIALMVLNQSNDITKNNLQEEIEDSIHRNLSMAIVWPNNNPGISNQQYIECVKESLLYLSNNKDKIQDDTREAISTIKQEMQDLIEVYENINGSTRILQTARDILTLCEKF